MMFDFLKVKQTIADVGAEVRKLRQERETAMRAREDLQSLPLNRDDFQALLENWVDRQAIGFSERLQTGAAFYMRNPMTDIPKDTKAPAHPMAILTAVRNPQDMATVGGLECNLFALLGPSIKQGLKAVLDEMDFSEAGPARAERIATIAALDARIIALDEEERGLVEEAEKAGLKI
jgi:hypothetical protein